MGLESGQSDTRGTGLRRTLLLLLALIVIAGLMAAFVGRLGPSERVYALDEVTRGMRQSPRAWVGRTVLVAGSMQQMSASGGAGGALVHVDYLHPPVGVAVLILLAPPHRPVSPGQFFDLDTHRHGAWLQVQPHLLLRRADPFQAFLQRMPLVGRFVPGPDDVTAAHVFRVTLLPVHAAFCGTSQCPDALLVGMRP